MNTILASVGAASCLSGLGMLSDTVGSKQNITLKFDLMALVGAILSGLVAVTASCNNITPASAVIIGFVAAIIYKTTVNMFERLEIDDPLQVSQVHGFCGLWGVLAVGIFDNDVGVINSG